MQTSLLLDSRCRVAQWADRFDRFSLPLEHLLSSIRVIHLEYNCRLSGSWLDESVELFQVNTCLCQRPGYSLQETTRLVGHFCLEHSGLSNGEASFPYGFSAFSGVGQHQAHNSEVGPFSNAKSPYIDLLCYQPLQHGHQSSWFVLYKNRHLFCFHFLFPPCMEPPSSRPSTTLLALPSARAMDFGSTSFMRTPMPRVLSTSSLTLFCSASILRISSEKTASDTSTQISRSSRWRSRSTMMR